MSRQGSLRIIAGTHKGRRLQTAEAPGTRPMTDRVRENLFNIIQMRLPDSAFLDLFSGSGAVGLEAISRGARESVFVEMSDKWCGVIKANISALGVESCSHLHCSDVFKALPAIKRNQKSFDIIFIGAPYDQDLHNTALEAVLAEELLAPGGIIIAQYRAGDPFRQPQGMQAAHRDYGITRLSFIEEETDD